MAKKNGFPLFRRCGRKRFGLYSDSFQSLHNLGFRRRFLLDFTELSVRETENDVVRLVS